LATSSFDLSCVFSKNVNARIARPILKRTVYTGVYSGVPSSLLHNTHYTFQSSYF